MLSIMYINVYLARQVFVFDKMNQIIIHILVCVCKFQSDYHNLIGITADLVDSLEATVQGRPVSFDSRLTTVFCDTW